MSTRATILTLIALAGVALLIMRTPVAQGPSGSVASFDDCIAAGYPVGESYPRRCFVPGGDSFTEDIQTGAAYENAVPGDIAVDSPENGAAVGREFSVTGRARGSWYHEGTFLVELRTTDGLRLGAGSANAQGDWMTDDLVPFRADMVAAQEHRGPALLVLWKANPSDLPENDAALTVPVVIGE